MSPEFALVAAVIGGAIAAVLAWQAAAAFFRPKYAVTVQKTVNTNQQPEVVTIQASLGRRATPDDLWMTSERMGLVATARMTSINDDILEEMTAESQKIAARKAERDSLREQLVVKRQRKKIAKLRGIPISQVTDEMIADARAKANAQQNGHALEPVS